MTKFVTRDAWKELPAEERAKSGVRRFQSSAKAKLTEEKARELGIAFKPRSYLWTLSTDVVDRYKDVIRVNGWQTENYKHAGSVVQWAHDTRSLPIGTMLTTWKETGLKQGHNRLRGVRHFHGETQLSKEVATLVDLDILRASSVGFMPLEMKDIMEEERWIGFDFVKSDLLEDSVVPVPANPDAIIGAKSAGNDFGAYREELERAIEEGLYGAEAKTVMEKAHGHLTTTQIFVPSTPPTPVETLAVPSLEVIEATITKAVEAAVAKHLPQTPITTPPSSDEDNTGELEFVGF